MLGDRCSSHAAPPPSASRRAGGDRASVSDCSGENPPSGKYGTYAMPCSASARPAVVLAAGDVVEVLHAHDRRDRLCLGELHGVHRRRPRCPISPCCCTRPARRTAPRPSHRRVPVVTAADPQVDHVERLEPERVRLSWTCSAGRPGPRVEPVAVLIAARADLGDEVEVIGVGSRSASLMTVGDVRAVEVGRVDVRDAERDGLAHSGFASSSAGGPKQAGAGELHGAVAQRASPSRSPTWAGAAGQRTVRGDVDRFSSECLVLGRRGSLPAAPHSTMVPCGPTREPCPAHPGSRQDQAGPVELPHTLKKSTGAQHAR